MIIKKTKFDGLLEIKFDIYSDKRGNFIKIFNKGNSKLFTNVQSSLGSSGICPRGR